MKTTRTVAWKRTAKQSLIKSGCLRALGHLREPGVVILRYHSIRENPDELDAIVRSGLTHGAGVFDRHMRLLSMEFEPVTVDDITGFASGHVRIPRRAVAITFDDGFADNCEIAAPIMSRHGIVGAFYVTTASIAPNPPPWFYRLRRAFHLTRVPTWTDPTSKVLHDLTAPDTKRKAFLQASAHCAAIGYPDRELWLGSLEQALECPLDEGSVGLMMDESQIRRLHSAGHIVGSHTVSHPNLARMPAEEIRRELADSKKTLETILGSPVRHLSYPSPILQPHFDDRTIELADQTGYVTGVTCVSGSYLSQDNPLACCRITVPSDMTELWYKIEMTHALFRR